MQKLNADLAVYADIMAIFKSYRDRLITVERAGKWRNTQGLHNAVYSAAGKLLNHESWLLLDIRHDFPDYMRDKDDAIEYLGKSYAREEIMTGATRLTLPRARNYIIAITDLCAEIMDTATEFYRQGDRIHEQAGRELCNAVKILTGIKLSGFKDADTLDPLTRIMLRKARTPAKELMLFGYKPNQGQAVEAAQVQEEETTTTAATQIKDEIKTPEIKKGKGNHGGKRVGAGRHKNAIQTVRITFKVTAEQAEEVKRFVEELRNRK